MRDARRAEGGGGWGCTSGRPALSVPRCPGVSPAGRSRGPGWPPPRAGRACGAAPGCARHPGTSPGGVNPEVQPGGVSVFMSFGLFWLTFACLLWFCRFGFGFFQKKNPRRGHLGLPLGPRCPRCVPTSGDRACRRARGDPHLGHDARENHCLQAPKNCLQAPSHCSQAPSWSLFPKQAPAWSLFLELVITSSTT